jgi:hypothetical protein
LIDKSLLNGFRDEFKSRQNFAPQTTIRHADDDKKLCGVRIRAGVARNRNVEINRLILAFEPGTSEPRGRGRWVGVIFSPA